MKRLPIALLVLLGLFPSRLASQDFQIFVGGGDPAPIDIPIWTSALVDLTGYGLIAAPLYAVSDEERIAFCSIGASAMAVGGLCWNLSLDAKTRHWKKEYDIDVTSSNRAKSWNLALWSTGFGLGSAIAGFIDSDDPSPEGFLISFVLGLAGGVFEFINLQGPRLRWMSDMSLDYDIQISAGPDLGLSPVIAASFQPESGGSSLLLGLKLSI